MDGVTLPLATRRVPRPRDVLELLKPVTWFPPMWAFMCGVVSSGVPLSERWGFLVAGMMLAGPLVCGNSQAINDWFDRHVDAINEPKRPIPSGRIPGRWGLYIAIGGTVLSFIVGALINPWVFAATILGVFLAWIYSAPPIRAKANGWWGPGVCAAAYEGLTWFTGAAVMVGGLPDAKILIILALYATGAHGIMVLNDFKAVEGDRVSNVRSLPVLLGVNRAAMVACFTMAIPQVIVAVLLARWGSPFVAALVMLSIAFQFLLMQRLLSDPAKHAPFYNATGTTLYVLGMLVSAIGLRALV
ncbi:MAG: bacteriochlorophyll/chlorophyll synthetase [Alphaproteobacteria bacterium PA4]|nr:MAG: bacteriochlorophyll/chlorophyll synthetase [Alphaproteobacteria bacterium PA4]